ncbi:DUF2939 domain-containing protein [Aliikangiella sp. IMCC44359]|uniref:DUF2939 domain-containing protein n=1 Tax=Aliikangiella sp. IMCC44359 TaxID=3459125 RepID=UPI00403A9E34
MKAINPRLVIFSFVKAVQKNDVEFLQKYVDFNQVKKSSKHGCTLEYVKALFKDIEEQQIMFLEILYEKNTRIIKVKMIKTLSLSFELRHQNTVDRKDDFYRIIGVYSC